MRLCVKEDSSGGASKRLVWRCSCRFLHHPDNDRRCMTEYMPILALPYNSDGKALGSFLVMEVFNLYGAALSSFGVYCHVVKFAVGEINCSPRIPNPWINLCERPIEPRNRCLGE